MKATIVTDTSRELPLHLIEKYGIYPLGYIIEDSKGIKHQERISVREVRSEELLEIVQNDRKTNIFAPSIKDFVELYTYLGEKYESVFSIHSSLVTPAVFENALVAKKLVSEVNIDVIDTQTFGASSGLFLEEISKVILKAKRINDVRKEAINLNRYINSFLLSKNDQLTTIGLRENRRFYDIKSTWQPYQLYHFYHNNWDELKRSRNKKSLIREMSNRIDILKQTKDFKNIFYSSNSEFKRDIKSIAYDIQNIKPVETRPSLISHYLTGKGYGEIAFI